MRLPRLARVATAALAVVAFAHCGDPSGSDRITEITIATPVPTLLVGPGGGQTRQLTATATTQNGKTVASPAFTWASFDPLIASVSQTGLVTAVAPGTTTISAAAGSAVDAILVIVADVPPATVTANADSVSLTHNTLFGAESRQLSAVLRDSTGTALPGRPVVWTTNAPLVAGVSITGMVTSVGAGQARIVASSLNGKSDTVVVTVTASDSVPADANITVVSANWTQAIQDAAGTIPMVQNGRPAVLNVLMSAARDIPTPSRVVLRITDAGGTLIRADTQTTAVSSTFTYTWAIPTLQFLVPASVLQPGRRWEVIRDPNGVLEDANAADDRWPRGGTAALNLFEAPPIKIRFVPIILTAHGDATGDVSNANLSEYLRVVRAILPFGTIEASIGPAMTSGQSFGTAPSGGASGFWTALLTEIDAARVADPTYADAHWIGVVRPPVGFNFTSFGGFGYIPANGASFGPATRTAALVTVGWFNRESQSRELVAHELGHTLGRRHAPCGNPAGPDPNFPNAGGVIGDYAHDVNSWALGLATSAAGVFNGAGDIMGYCNPPWISAYTYSGIMNFRGPATTPLRALMADGAARPVRSLLVRGTAREGRVALEPTLGLEVAAMGEDRGDHVVTGRSAAGTVLFERRFTLTELDHDVTTRAFAVTVPVDDALLGALASIEVRGPSGSAARLRSARALDAQPVMSRTVRGAVVSCPAGTAAITVQDATSGRLLAVVNGAEARLAAVPRASVRIACSDGVRAWSSELRPQ